MEHGASGGNAAVFVCCCILLIGVFLGAQTHNAGSERRLSDSADSSYQAMFAVDRSFGNFVDAVSLSTNGSGEIFVVDAGANKLYQSEENGDQLKFIGGQGWGDLEFDHPTDVCASFPLDIYVADYNNRRVQRFDHKLNFIQSFTEENLPPSYGGGFYPRACTISSQGELFVVESEGKRIIKFDQNQNFQKEFGSYSAGAGALKDPRDIVISSGDTVFVLDEHRVVQYDTFGNYLGSFLLIESENPSAISCYSDGILVSFPSSIEAFSFTGAPLFRLMRDHIVGFPPGGEIHDALTLSSKLFILTNHTIIVGKTIVSTHQ